MYRTRASLPQNSRHDRIGGHNRRRRWAGFARVRLLAGREPPAIANTVIE
jgi:hypothetical protein